MIAAGLLPLLAGLATATPAPLLRDFMGVNGHTVTFRPALYAPVVSQARDYHPVDWDLGADTASRPPFPQARNGVDWHAVYGSWRAAGFTTDACLMFDMIGATRWRDPVADPRAYGEAFARAFGPGAATPLVDSAEIGNEPGKYDDAAYRRAFSALAAGLRAGDPRLTILPCALTMTTSGEYARSIACLDGLDGLYDALNLHVYALAAGWPTWRRSYPEDPAIPFLDEVRAALAWRDEHAPAKPVWITEFGWDASTRTPAATAENPKWMGVTDVRQAQYLVRAFLVFARLGVAKAYVYFFNDEDEPSFHAASGLTRHFVPKPSFHAVAHLRRLLGDFRFDRVVREVPGAVYAYRFTHASDPDRAAVVIWSPTGAGLRGTLQLDLEGWDVKGCSRMPVDEREARAPFLVPRAGRVAVRYDESPVYLLLQRR